MIAGPTVITGGGRGIGVAIARRVAADGGAVSLWGRNPDSLRAVAAELKDAGRDVHTAVADVGKEDDVRRAADATAERFGGIIRSVVNNAGLANPGPFEELTVPEWDELFAVNSRGVMLVTKFTLPYLRRAGGGSYVNIVSEVGLLNQAGNVAYGASKAAAVSFSKGLAIELAGDNIRVNIVAPGPVETDMWDGAVKKRAGAEGLTADEFRQKVLSRIPTHRFTDVTDVAEAVAYLLDEDRSRSAIGTHLMVTAGSTVC
jgi:NAD(P)-dependent dehydrogenase (short-subunit alcohol dehydrogenase family)